MGDQTVIEWTDATWNPVSGCTKVSPGCANCYAERITLRFKQGLAFLPNVAEIKTRPERLMQPYHWKKPRCIFVCSMSDLFHEAVPSAFIREVFTVIRANPRHTFQVLTKRAERLYSELFQYVLPSHLWVGVSVENQFWANRRIPYLIQVPASVRFLSCEPLLKPVNLEPYIRYLDWVIVGGESGPGARPCNPEWVRAIRDLCQEYKVPFFFKQWGGSTPKAGGRALDGRTWSEWPEPKLWRYARSCTSSTS